MPGAGVQLQSHKRGGLFDQPYLLLSLTALFWAGNTVLGRFLAGHVPPITLAFIRWGRAFRFCCRSPRSTSCAIGRPSQTHRTDGRAGGDRGLRLQHDGLLRLAIHDRDQRPVVAVHRSSVCRPVDLRAVWRPIDGALRPAASASRSPACWLFICHGSLAVLTGIAFNRGDLWFLIALAIYGFYTAWLRKRAADASALVSRRQHGPGSAAAVVPAVAVELAGGRTVELDAVTLSSFAYVCVFPSLLGYLFLNRGIELIGANRAAPFMHLTPVFGSVLAIVLLGETVRALSRRGLRAGLHRDHGGDAEVLFKTAAAWPAAPAAAPAPWRARRPAVRRRSRSARWRRRPALAGRRGRSRC